AGVPFLRDQLLDLLRVTGKASAEGGVGSSADAAGTGHRREQWIRNLRGLLGEDLILFDLLVRAETLLLAGHVRGQSLLLHLERHSVGRYLFFLLPLDRLGRLLGH